MNDEQLKEMASGQSEKIAFKMREEDLRFYTSDMSFGSETGTFAVCIGGSDGVQNSAAFVPCDTLDKGGCAYELS